MSTVTVFMLFLLAGLIIVPILRAVSDVFPRFPALWCIAWILIALFAALATGAHAQQLEGRFSEFARRPFWTIPKHVTLGDEFGGFYPHHRIWVTPSRPSDAVTIPPRPERPLTADEQETARKKGDRLTPGPYQLGGTYKEP